MAKPVNDANPMDDPVVPVAPENVVIEDGRRKYQYVAIYHGPSEVLELAQHELFLLRDIPTDVSPAAADDLEVRRDVTVDHIPLEVEAPSDKKKGK